jgi:hypothetical protein
MPGDLGDSVVGGGGPVRPYAMGRSDVRSPGIMARRAAPMPGPTAPVQPPAEGGGYGLADAVAGRPARFPARQIPTSMMEPPAPTFYRPDGSRVGAGFEPKARFAGVGNLNEEPPRVLPEPKPRYGSPGGGPDMGPIETYRPQGHVPLEDLPGAGSRNARMQWNEIRDAFRGPGGVAEGLPTPFQARMTEMAEDAGRAAMGALRSPAIRNTAAFAGLQFADNPRPMIQALGDPRQALAGTAGSLWENLTSPSTTWRPGFEQGLVNLMQGDVAGPQLADAVWHGGGDTTGIRPAYNLGHGMGDTISRAAFDSQGLGRDFNRGLAEIKSMLAPVPDIDSFPARMQTGPNGQVNW